MKREAYKQGIMAPKEQSQTSMLDTCKTLSILVNLRDICNLILLCRLPYTCYMNTYTYSDDTFLVRIKERCSTLQLKISIESQFSQAKQMRTRQRYPQITIHIHETHTSLFQVLSFIVIAVCLIDTKSSNRQNDVFQRAHPKRVRLLKILSQNSYAIFVLLFRDVRHAHKTSAKLRQVLHIRGGYRIF